MIAGDANVALVIDIVAMAICELALIADANHPTLSIANTDAAPYGKVAGTWKVAVPVSDGKLPIVVEMRVPASVPL